MTRILKIGVFLMVFTSLTMSASAAIKLAVLGTPDQQDAATCLIAELSRDPEKYLLLDRDQLERVVGEQKLKAQGLTQGLAMGAGRILDADGVLWVDSALINGSKLSIVRLSATRSGAVVGWQVENAKIPDMGGWAVLLSKRIDTWSAKLGISREQAVPISIVNLRGATDSQTSKAAAHTIGTLLGSRLTAQPQLFVLERWRLNELAWEQILSTDPESGFWNGAWLLDGSLIEVDGNIELNMRLRSADGHELRWTKRGQKIEELVNEIATDVLQYVAHSHEAVPWDPIAEAKEFLAEAEWALRWKLNERALESSEAAIALGLNSAAAQRWRYLACSRLAVDGPKEEIATLGICSGWFRAWPQHYPMPSPTRFEQTLRAFRLFNDFRLSPEGADFFNELEVMAQRLVKGQADRPVPRPEQEAAELLNNASRLLWTAYFSPDAHAHAQDTLLNQLRLESRTFFADMFPRIRLDINQRDPDLVPDVDRGGRGTPIQMNTLAYTEFVHGVLWMEKASDQEVWIRTFLSSEVTGEGHFYDELMQLTTSMMQWDVQGVDWASHDSTKTRTGWMHFAEGLLGDKDAGLRLAGAVWLLSLQNSFLAEHQPPDEKQTQAAWRTLLSMLDRVEDGRVSARYFIEGALRASKVYSGANDELTEYLAARFELPDPIPGPLAKIATSMNFTAEQKTRLAQALAHRIADKDTTPLWQDADQAIVMKCLRYFDLQLPPAVAAADALPSCTPSVRQAAVNVFLAWHGPEGRSGTSPEFVDLRSSSVRWASLVANRLWLICVTQKNHYSLQTVDLPGFQAKTLMSWETNDNQPDRPFDFPAYTVLGGSVYSWENGTVCRRRIGEGRVESIPMPVTQRPKMWAVDEKLYLGLKDGGVLRFDPRADKWELLADSHRRPAQGLLDDCRPYTVQTIWRDESNRLCLAKDMRGTVYCLDEASLSWSSVPDHPCNLLTGSPSFDRDGAVGIFRNIAFASLDYAFFTAHMLVRDVDRAGKSPHHIDPGEYFGGEPPIIHPNRREARWSMVGGVAEANDFWVLFGRGCPLTPRLVWMPKLPAETVSIELKMPSSVWDQLVKDRRLASGAYGGFFGERPRILPGPAGLVIYSTGSPVVWFVSRQELNAAGASRSPNP